MPQIQDKGFDAKEWIFRGVQALAFMFLGNFYVTSIETNKEILKTLYELREQVALAKQQTVFQIKRDEDQDKKLEKYEAALEELRRKQNK